MSHGSGKQSEHAYVANTASDNMRCTLETILYKFFPRVYICWNTQHPAPDDCGKWWPAWSDKFREAGRTRGEERGRGKPPVIDRRGISYVSRTDHAGTCMMRLKRKGIYDQRSQSISCCPSIAESINTVCVPLLVAFPLPLAAKVIRLPGIYHDPTTSIPTSAKLAIGTHF